MKKNLPCVQVGPAACAMTRALLRFGEPWSALILREAFEGTTRFDQFQKNLGISPSILTRRLNMLIDEGLLARRQYCPHPPRFEYILTDRGRDFRPVLQSLMAWGVRHFTDPGDTPPQQV
jgi:DNA-binding HxlR family transcriptional regulator